MKEVALKHADELLAAVYEKAMFALRKKMDADSVLGPHYGHMRPQVRIRLDFIFKNINLPKTGFQVEAEADWAILDSTERELLIDNPNLTRADAGLPFTHTVVDESGPDRNFKALKKEEIPVDTSNLPAPIPPVDTDKTAELEEELRVSEEKLAGGRRKKGRHAEAPVEPV